MKTAEISLEEMKSQVLSMVNASDDLEALGKVRDLLEEFRKKNTVVGYEPDGSPVSLFQFEQEIAIATEEVDNGHFLTIEEAEKEIRSWK